MDQHRNNWPIILGVTAGIVSVVVAGVVLHAARDKKSDSAENLRDAQDIITQCHKKIREIEAGLESLRQPIGV